MEFYDKIYKTVQQIPYGRVATYGQIALLAGRARAARAVGTAMSRSPYGESVPCHRVVNSKGGTTVGTFAERGGQKKLLEDEGVFCDACGRVNLKLYGWDPFERPDKEQVKPE